MMLKGYTSAILIIQEVNVRKTIHSRDRRSKKRNGKIPRVVCDAVRRRRKTGENLYSKKTATKYIATELKEVSSGASGNNIRSGLPFWGILIKT